MFQETCATNEQTILLSKFPSRSCLCPYENNSRHCMAEKSGHTPSYAKTPSSFVKWQQEEETHSNSLFIVSLYVLYKFLVMRSLGKTSRRDSHKRLHRGGVFYRSGCPQSLSPVNECVMSVCNCYCPVSNIILQTVLKLKMMPLSIANLIFVPILRLHTFT